MIRKLKFPFYMMLHPFQGLERLKERTENYNLMAALLVFVYFLSQLFSEQVTSFSFNPANTESVNVGMVFLVSVIPVILFSASNWCLSTLTQGEATFSEIFTAVSFALLPVILINITVAAVSNVMSLEEELFFILFNGFKNLWFAAYLFVGIKTVQQFTFLKTVVSLLLTLAGMAVIAFLFILVYSLFYQLFIFIGTIYNELSFRM